MPEIRVASSPGWIKVRAFISLCFLTIDTMWSVTSYFWPLVFPIMMSCTLKLWVQLVSFYFNLFSQIFCQNEVASAETWHWLSWGTASCETLWEIVCGEKMWVRLFFFVCVILFSVHVCACECACTCVKQFLSFLIQKQSKIIRYRRMFECILKENKTYSTLPPDNRTFCMQKSRDI